MKIHNFNTVHRKAFDENSGETVTNLSQQTRVTLSEKLKRFENKGRQLCEKLFLSTKKSSFPYLKQVKISNKKPKFKKSHIETSNCQKAEQKNIEIKILNKKRRI